VLIELLKSASELKSVSCGQNIPDAQYSVCERIKTGRWLACEKKQATRFPPDTLGSLQPPFDP